MTIHKAIFPVAGLGTRTLPATKIIAKELLPVVDKPVIQYAVEEAIAAGISEIIFVTAHTKRSIEAHFSNNDELEQALLAKGRKDLYELVHDILPAGVSLKAAIQEQPLGLGHAVLCARELAEDETVAVLLPDDLIFDGDRGCMAQMVAMYERLGHSIIAIEEVAREDTSKYGIVELERGDNGDERLLSVVEKPDPAAAPSTSAIVGRYILSASIWDKLEQTGTGSGNEIQLTDAIAAMLAEEPAYVCRFEGTRYDCGSKAGYIRAVIDYARRHDEIGKDIEAYLSQLK